MSPIAMLISVWATLGGLEDQEINIRLPAERNTVRHPLFSPDTRRSRHRPPVVRRDGFGIRRGADFFLDEKCVSADFSSSQMPEPVTITIIIEGLRSGTSMIEEAETGPLVETDVRPVEADDLLRLEPGWRFDWRDLVKSEEIFKLIDPEAPDAILGLLALTRNENFVEVTLLESNPRNVGRKKKLRGVPGSLLAFAAQLSFNIGGDGFIAIVAKTELIEHYQRVYGFERVAQSQRMILTTVAAARLIAQYRGRQTDG